MEIGQIMEDYINPYHLRFPQPIPRHLQQFPHGNIYTCMTF